MIAESEDLPGMKLDSHELLAENMHACPFGSDREAASFAFFFGDAAGSMPVFGLRFCAGFFFPAEV